MAASTSRAAQVLSHEEIVKSFVSTRAIDFNALGKFVAEFGESIVISGRGDYGVRFGHFNILACFKIASRDFSALDIGGSGLGSEVIGH